MIQTSCISDDGLRGLLLGEISDEDAAPLESHLLECPACVARTRSLRSADTLVVALQQARDKELPAAQSSSIDRLVQRLSDRSQLGTHPSLLDATDAPTAKDSPNVQDLIALLEPAAGPGELGRLGGFRVLKLLGHGGMGAVFLAEDVQLRRHVALKLLKPGRSGHGDAVERFMREARAAAAVRHDHVVTIYQVGEAHGVPFIAQELLEGETLDDRLKRDARLPIADALRIGREIASGLAAAHHRGLLHRDVKPSNIWLESHVVGNALRGIPRVGVDDASATEERHRGRSLQDSSRVKILDFGLARSQQGDEQLTQAGMVVGTPAYMSPEQATSQPLDARTDLFSLGGVLYRMVTGRLPFQGNDTLSMLRSLAVDEPPPACSLNPEIPDELSDLIAQLLAKDVNYRPQSADAVARTLASIENQLTSPAARSKHASGDLPTTPTPSLRPSVSPSLSRLRTRGFAIITTAAAALAIALAVFLTVRTPYGEVIVELGPGVKAEDVKIEVKGNSEVKVADAKHGWTIDVREGRYNVQLAANTDRFDIDKDTVTVNRNKKTHVKVTLKSAVAAQVPEKPATIPLPATITDQKTPKPIYENDFTSWLPGFPRPKQNEQGIYSIQDGHYIIQTTGQNPWWFTDCAYLPKSADIELVGRATIGAWGITLRDDDEPRFGVRVGIDSSGQLELVKIIQPTRGKRPNILGLIDSRSKTTGSWKGGGSFNVMRVRLRDGKMSIWLNGKEACDEIDLPDAITSPVIAVSGHHNEIGLYCEFDSIRVWRAGEGPPRP